MFDDVSEHSSLHGLSFFQIINVGCNQQLIGQVSYKSYVMYWKREWKTTYFVLKANFNSLWTSCHLAWRTCDSGFRQIPILKCHSLVLLAMQLIIKFYWNHDHWWIWLKVAKYWNLPIHFKSKDEFLLRMEENWK